MNILFVNLSTSGARYFPTGVMLLVSMLRINRFNVTLYDTNFIYIIDRFEYYTNYVNTAQSIGIHKKVENGSEYLTKVTFHDEKERLQSAINSVQPDIIAVSAFSDSYLLARELIKNVSLPDNCPVVIGGIHCKVDAYNIIREGYFDFAFEYEAEESLLLLCQMLDNGGSVSMNMIDGVYWRDKNGQIHHNPIKAVPDLTNLPIPDLSDFDERYFTRPYDGKLMRIINYETSRGCPYSCTYCINSMFHKQNIDGHRLRFQLRRKNIKQITKELRALIDLYDFEMVVFMDETFLSSRMEYLRELADVYLREIGLPFTISTRPESITEEKVKLLKTMGCKSVSIGVECGNEEVRAEVLNRKMSNKVIIKAFDLLNLYSIRNSSLNLIGIPGETESNIHETIELNRRLNPSTISVAILYPYLGTRIRELCIEKGYLDPVNIQHPVNPISTSILNFPNLSSKTIEHYFQNFVELCRKPSVYFSDSNMPIQ